MIEYRWLQRLQEAHLFAYRFDAAEFHPYRDERELHAMSAQLVSPPWKQARSRRLEPFSVR